MAQGRSIGGVVRGLPVADCPGSRLGRRHVWPQWSGIQGAMRMLGSHGCLRNAAELNALMLAVRRISVALQLEELGVPCLDTSFVSDNKYALGILQFETRAVANHAQAQMARQWNWAAKKSVRSEVYARACPHRSCGQ